MPTGNIADLLNNLFEKNSDAVNVLSSAIGAVADVSGTVSAVIAVVDTFSNLLGGGPDPATQAILNALQTDFAHLYAALEARQKEEDWRNLANQISQAESVGGILDGLVTAEPPLTDEERLVQIATCLAPLYALSDGSSHPPSPFFLTVYSEQVYWTDAGLFLQGSLFQNLHTHIWHVADYRDVGYGTVAPPPPPDDQVFFYVYVLPYYLKGLFILTAVGTSLYGDFATTAARQQDSIILFANFLATIHDLIAGAITNLSPGPPPWPLRTLGVNGNFVRGIIGDFTGLGKTSQPSLVGKTVIWGAVEQFSGFSSIKLARVVDVLNYEEMFKKIQIRVLRDAMKVYAGVGLLKVSTAINSLRKLTGQEPLPPHKYARWSFREIFAAAGTGPRSDGYFHLSDMARLLRANPPLDTSQTGPYSWRDLLGPRFA
jgi:hypothetical protein